MFDCSYIDKQGFCKLYSNSDVVWKCREKADCIGYREEDPEEEEDGR